MNKNVKSFLKFVALPAFLLTVLPALFLISCGGDEKKSSGVDLTPDDFAVSATSVVKDTEVRLSLKVRNQGTDDSGTVTVTFYKSIDGTISSSDDEVEVDTSIASLDGGALSAELSTTTTESTAGPVYYGACVVTTDDTNANNDCTAGTKVTFTETAGVDLIPYGFAVSATSVVKSSNVKLSLKVRNQGTADSGTVTVTFYKSADGTITSADTAVGNKALTSLDGGALSDELSVMATESTAGPVYYGACVVTIGEPDTSNNCTAGTEVTFTNNPDLSLDNLRLYDGSSEDTDQSINYEGKIHMLINVGNSGDGDVAAGKATVKFYRSASAVDGIDDVLLESKVINDSLAGQQGLVENITSVEFNQIDIGTFYFGACVELANDGTTGTKCLSKEITVANAPDGIDLLLEELVVYRVLNGIATPLAPSAVIYIGDTLRIYVSIKSLGNTAPTSDVTLEFRRNSGPDGSGGALFEPAKTITGLSANGGGNDRVNRTSAEKAQTASIGVTLGTTNYRACLSGGGEDTAKIGDNCKHIIIDIQQRLN